MSVESKQCWWLVGPKTAQRVYTEKHPDLHAAPVVHTWSHDWGQYEALNLSGDVVVARWSNGMGGSYRNMQTVAASAELTSAFGTRR